MDKTSVIFNNPMDAKTIKEAYKSKQKYIDKYGDDSMKDYHLQFEPIDTLDFMNVKNIKLTTKPTEAFPKNAFIVGNIRMGFGHYRISMAMASCAHALGFEPYWLDLASFDATGSKMIREQNDMYSLASRISQKSRAFNHLVWEPMNKDGFKEISYNAKDQANSELLVPLFKNIDKDIPYIATHVWPSQAAIHAGMSHVVNAIPDNWPMALHLSEGAIHTVQTPFTYLGYKMLDGFSDRPLYGMKDSDLKMVGHYVDHELLKDLKHDNELRIKRVMENKPIRLLMTVGGAGAGVDQFIAMIRHLMPYVDQNKATLFINFGDHLKVYDEVCKRIGDFKEKSTSYFNEYEKLCALSKEIYEGECNGIHVVYNDNIFEAVYSTNLLMKDCDILITKPSELVYYPIPKIFMKHIGGHEAYGAYHGLEYGDATYECDTSKKMNIMLDTMLSDKELLVHMIHRIDELNGEGFYNGAYECVKLAAGLK